MPAETPLDIRAINVALTRALGIEDVQGVLSVDVRLRPGCLPAVTVVRHVRGDAAAGVQQVAQQFELGLRPRTAGSAN